MKNNNRILSSILAMTVPFSASCANASRNSAYAQDKTITLEEWEEWARLISSSVVNAPSFNRYPSPVVVAIGDFTNSSSRMDVTQDKDVFLNALQRTMVNSGRVTVTRLYSGNAGRKDSVTVNSKELVDDPQFRSGSTAGMSDQAEAARLVLSLQYIQKRTVNRSGDSVFENYFHIELIDQVSKTAVYSDDVRLKKLED